MNSPATIDPNRVVEILTDCLEESAAPIEAVMASYALSPAKLEKHRPEIEQMLGLLDDSFMDDAGGGMSFLNVCEDRQGNLWTGLHSTCEQLLALGQGLGLVTYPFAREMWDILPGSMPYVLVARSKFRVAA